ncbi:uncharacterized protein LOC120345386 [Styela clava]
MLKLLIFIAVIVQISNWGVLACEKLKKTAAIDFKQYSGGWNWAMNSKDEFTDLYKCSRFSVVQRGKKSAIKISLKYGPNPHQVYQIDAKHISGNVYDLSKDFTASWRNIIRYNYPKTSKSILSKEVKGHRNLVSFYADRRRRFLIASLCLPNNERAVWVLTKLRRNTPTLRKLIQRQLKKAGIKTHVVRTYCPLVRNGKAGRRG